jgi:hypothetical protein
MGSTGRHSKLCGRREEREMAMIKEVRCLPHTEARYLAPGLRPAQGGRIGYVSARLRVAEREHQRWRCLHPPEAICFMFCLGQHDEAKHRAGPVLDDLPAIGPPAVWVGEGHGDGEDVDR